LTVLFQERVPRFDERGPVAVHVLKVPVAAAAREARLLAQTFDFDRAHPLLSEQGIARLKPVLD
jgi:hypothetical protein